MSTLPAPTLGELLRHARRAAGLTQEELAARAGISADAISVLERGLTRAPHRETLNLLAEALRLAPEERAQWEQTRRETRLPERLPFAYQLPAGRRRLPIPATPLIGRELEVQAMCALLQRPEVRLLTLTGSAGVGKTRLALQVAAELIEMFAQGVQFVSLAALNDPQLVLPTLAEALGLREQGTLPVLTLLANALHEQQMLLVLDNFEQVIAAAPVLAALLEACSGVKLLVTSREVLHLRAEQQFVVQPLALPELPSRSPLQQIDSTTLEKNPAVQLFLQRGRAAQPDFHLTPDNAATIVEICHRLDGIPLAIELAAPRLKLLSPQALLRRLEGRLQVLTGGARDLPERQRTMRATVAWSYELLSPAEQALFRRLAVFADGWTLEAAEQVCLGAGAPQLDMLEGLGSLLDKSLLYQEHESSGEARFRMLYVLREFGLEQLEAEEEATATREAYATYYLALAEEANSQLQGCEQKGWRSRLAHEHDNLRAALNWWLEQAHTPEAAERALRLWWALSQSWCKPACYREGYDNVKHVLAVRAGVGEAMQVKALLYGATVLLAVDEVEQAEPLVQEALVLARQAGDLPGTIFALMHLGGVAVHQDLYPVAQASFQEAAALARQTGDAWNTGIALKSLVDVLLIMGEYERAQVLAEECLAIFRAQGAARQIGESLAHLGRALFIAQGDLARATSLVEQGLAILRESGPISSTGWALFLLGMMRRQQQQLDESLALLEESLACGRGQWEAHELFQRQTRLARLLAQQGKLARARALYQENRAFLPTAGYKYLIADYLEGRGMLEAALGEPGAAARLWGAAESLREAIGAPMYPVDRDEYAQAVATARTDMGERAFAAAWAEGQALTPEAALAAVD